VDVHDRVKRPSLERSRALRSWETLFAVPSSERERTEPGPGASSQTDRPASLDDVVSRSVTLGYRVVDEYIRQGQKAAQQLGNASYGPQTMASDAQDLATRMLQYASDFAALWLEFVQVAAVGAPAPAAQTRAGEPGPEPASSDAAEARPGPLPRREAHAIERTGLRIELVATQPTEVSLEMQPDSDGQPLIVHALRTADPEIPRLNDVSFIPQSAEHPARLRICVPTEQPPGSYHGLIIDERSSRPVGSVSVRVDPRANQPR